MMILFVNENFAQKHNKTQPRGLNVSQQLPEMLILTLLDQLAQKRKLEKHMSHLLLLGKFEYGGGPIFKVVLEC